MTLKFTSSPGSAYEVAVGATAEEAHDNKLVVVELNYSTNPPSPVFGRYKDAPKGAALGITVDKPGDTQVIGGGSVAAPADAPAANQKGALVNLNDPFVHGGTGDESIHADGSEPPVRDIAAEEREAVKAAQEAKPTRTKSAK